MKILSLQYYQIIKIIFFIIQLIKTIIINVLHATYILKNNNNNNSLRIN